MRKFLLALSVVVALLGTGYTQCSQKCKSAFEVVVRHEDHNMSGVVTKEPFGGVARFGVNSRAHPEAVHAGYYRMPRLRALRYAQSLFWRSYWLPIHGDEIRDDRLATKLADLAYNLGPVRATILLQRALNQLGSGLVARGYLGGDTLSALSNLPSPALLVLVKYQAAGFYTRLAHRHPAQMQAWKATWLNRLSDG